MAVLQAVAEVLVHHPERVAGIAILLLLAWRIARRPNPLWVPGALWLVYAIWECLVKIESPDANIRADLLVIWPVVSAATVWAVVRVVIRRFGRQGGGR